MDALRRGQRAAAGAGDGPRPGRWRRRPHCRSQVAGARSGSGMRQVDLPPSYAAEQPPVAAAGLSATTASAERPASRAAHLRASTAAARSHAAGAAAGASSAAADAGCGSARTSAGRDRTLAVAARGVRRAGQCAQIVGLGRGPLHRALGRLREGGCADQGTGRAVPLAGCGAGGVRVAQPVRADRAVTLSAPRTGNRPRP